MTDPRQLQFWDDEEGELWEILSELLVVTLSDGVAEGISALPANIQVLADWNWINQSVLDYVKSYRFDWIKKITDTTRTQVQQAITDWIQEGSPLSVLEDRLTPIFGDVRAQMIATTEVTRVYAEGNKKAWDSTGVVSRSKWQTGVDDLVCPECAPLQDQVTDEMPPLHVNCRCYKLPVVDESLFEKKLENIFK